MAKKKSSSTSGDYISINMEGVEARTLLPEGDYIVAVDEIEKKTSENSGHDFLSWKFKVASGEYKGQAVFYNTSLQPQALFNLKGLLIALGVTVPNGAMKIRFNELIGEKAGVTVEHDSSYDGKPRAKIVDIFPLDQLEEAGDDDGEEGEDEEEQEEVKKPKSTKKAATKKATPAKAEADDDDDDEDDEDEKGEDESEEEEDPLAAMSLKQLIKYAKDNEIDISHLSKKALQNEDKVRQAIAEELED